MDNGPKIPGGTGQVGAGAFDVGGLYIDGGGYGGTNPIEPDFGWDVPPLEPPKPLPLPPPSDGVDAAPDTDLPPTKDTRPTAPPPPPAAPPSPPPTTPTEPSGNKDAAYWSEQILRNGTQGFMDALLAGDESAKAALRDPSFMATLQMMRQEETQLITLISNLVKEQGARASAVIRNITA